MRRMFNREYQIRATRQSLRVAAAQAFYRPAERPNPVPNPGPETPRRPQGRLAKLEKCGQLPIVFNMEEYLAEEFERLFPR